MKHPFSILVIMLFFSCSPNKKSEITISNNTSSIIDSIKITYGTEKEFKNYLIKNINAGDKVKTVLDMQLKGIDGGYYLEVFQNKKTTGQDFGYYSNAKFKNSIFEVKIEKDTLIINENLKANYNKV